MVPHKLGQSEHYFVSITLFFYFITTIVFFYYGYLLYFNCLYFYFSMFSAQLLALAFLSNHVLKNNFLSQGSIKPLYPSKIEVRSAYTPPSRKPTCGTISGMLLFFISTLKKDQRKHSQIRLNANLINQYILHVWNKEIYWY